MGLLDYDFNQLAGNPLVQMGLGILANNQGHYGQFAPAFGIGASQGLVTAQQMQNAQERMKAIGEEMKLRKQELEQRQQQGDTMAQIRMAQLLQGQQKKPIVVGNTVLDPETFKPLYSAPEKATEYGLQPKIAKNPETNKWDMFVPDKSGGVKWLNVEVPPNMPAFNYADETGNVPNGYLPQPPNAIPQPQGNNAPQSVPVPSAMPYTWSGQTPTDVKEGTSPNMTLAPIGLPPKASRAVNQEVAKEKLTAPIKVETTRQETQAKADIELAQKQKEAQQKKETTMAGIGSLIDRAKFILTNPDVTPTHSIIGNVADAAMGAFGLSNPGAEKADALRAIGGALVARMPRMEGPQSNFDVQNYREMAGQVGDPTIPIERRLAALQEVENIYRKYDKESAPAKTVVQRGKYGGRNVVKYSDGSIDYAD